MYISLYAVTRTQEHGMRQGVNDSDIFILFLTNSVLSRSYCMCVCVCVILYIHIYMRRTNTRALTPEHTNTHTHTRIHTHTQKGLKEIGWAIDAQKPILILQVREMPFIY